MSTRIYFITFRRHYKHLPCCWNMNNWKLLLAERVLAINQTAVYWILFVEPRRNNKIILRHGNLLWNQYFVMWMYNTTFKAVVSCVVWQLIYTIQIILTSIITVYILNTCIWMINIFNKTIVQYFMLAFYILEIQIINSIEL